MKLLIKITLLLLATTQGFAQGLRTPWTDEVEANLVLPEYPRPILQRQEWKNLNGTWEYSVTKDDIHTRFMSDDASRVETLRVDSLKFDSLPTDIHFRGDILVPFCVESSLSGIERALSGDSLLWYHRKFTIPDEWEGQRIRLNFGAVDWEATVWINGIYVGTHRGGYTPFSFDITDALLPSTQQDITLRVWDPTDSGYQPRGKQVEQPRTIWYTSVSGIWQTVWIEPVSERHIAAVLNSPDIDKGTLTCRANVGESQEKDEVHITVMHKGDTVATACGKPNTDICILMPEDFLLWDTENPNLYDLTMLLTHDSCTLDSITSYAAMRQFSISKDIKGYPRLTLNHQELFQFGLLDQGYWPDGIYTAPTDEAMLFDIEKTKAMGFNMIRKHIKIEPARWYTYCDRMGMIVWQDMPNGDNGVPVDNSFPTQTNDKRSAESVENHMREWEEIMNHLMPYPCICMWIIFNEGGGQFQTQMVANWTKAHDPSRIVNAASGGNYYACGDVLDTHHYPNPIIRFPANKQYVQVEGEFGGLACPIEGHLWQQDNNWGYKNYNTTEELTLEYIKNVRQLFNLKSRGLSAAVYTQTTDVEIEVNGLMTYDREVTKMDEELLRIISHHVIYGNSLPDEIITSITNQPDTTSSGHQSGTYDLLGRRLTTTPKAGIYIENGRKRVR